MSCWSLWLIDQGWQWRTEIWCWMHGFAVAYIKKKWDSEQLLKWNSIILWFRSWKCLLVIWLFTQNSDHIHGSAPVWWIATISGQSDFFSRLAAVGSLLLLVATVLGIYASILIVRGNHHGDKSYNWCCRYGTYDPSPAMLCQNQLCCAGARKGEDHPYLGGPGVCDYKEGIHRPYKDALDPRLKDPNYHWSQWYCEKDTCGDKISLCGPERFDFGNSTAQKIEEILRRNQACCNIDRCIHKDDVANACVCSWVFAILSLISVMAFRFCDSNTPLFSCNEKGFPPWRWIWYPAFFMYAPPLPVFISGLLVQWYLQATAKILWLCRMLHFYSTRDLIKLSHRGRRSVLWTCHD